jgi:hypothetical protein
MARFGLASVQYFDDDGIPLGNGYLNFFESGTTTGKVVYSDEAMTIPHLTNVPLDPYGRQPDIWFQGIAKVVLKSSAGVQIGDDADPVGDVDGASNFQTWIADRDPPYSPGEIAIGSDGQVYYSLISENDSNPVSTPTEWGLYKFVKLWNQYETFPDNQVAQGSDGFLYSSQQASNVNHNPVGDNGTWWLPGVRTASETQTGIVELATSAETTAGVSTTLATTPAGVAAVTGPITTSIATKVTGVASSVDNEIMLFDSTTGKLAKRATTTGLLKATSGVIGAAVAGTDIKTIGGVSPLGAGNITLSNGDYQEFTSSGTWNKPAGATLVYVEAIGAGGSGAAANSAGSPDQAGGGGGGLFVDGVFLASSLTSTVAVTIGAGGTAVATGNNGNAGGNTTFAAYLTAPGGGAGSADATFAAGGLAGGLLGTSIASGSGAAAVAGDYAGGAGGGAGTSNGAAGGSAVKGGAGGGGAGPSTAAGGGTSLQGGNGGAGSTSGNGTAGTAPGGGGGGTSFNTGTSGAGGAGRVRVWAW